MPALSVGGHRLRPSEPADATPAKRNAAAGRRGVLADGPARVTLGAATGPRDPRSNDAHTVVRQMMSHGGSRLSLADERRRRATGGPAPAIDTDGAASRTSKPWGGWTRLLRHAVSFRRPDPHLGPTPDGHRFCSTCEPPRVPGDTEGLPSGVARRGRRSARDAAIVRPSARRGVAERGNAAARRGVSYEGET